MAEVIGATELEGTISLEDNESKAFMTHPLLHVLPLPLRYFTACCCSVRARLQPYDQRWVPTSTAGKVLSGTTPELAPEVCPNGFSAGAHLVAAIRSMVSLCLLLLCPMCVLSRC